MAKIKTKTDALTNYIYWKNQDWTRNKSALAQAANINTNQIYAAYNANANALQHSFLGGRDLPDDFVDNVIKLLDFSPEADRVIKDELDAKIGDSFFSDIQNYVNSELTKTVLGKNLTVGNINVKLKQMELNAKQLTKIVAGFQKIQKKISQFSKGFIQLQKNLPNSTVGFLSSAEMKKTKVAYQALQSFLNKYGQNPQTPVQSVEKLKKEILRLIGLIVGDLKGGLYEYADYIHNQALMAIKTPIQQFVQQSGGNVIVSGGLLTGTSKSTTEKEGEKIHDFVSKADNVVILTTIDNNGFLVNINLGISDKSYKEGKADRKSIAEGVSWSSVMNAPTGAGLSSLTETAFQYYYANLMYFSDSDISKPKSLVNRFLAAKASAFLISGVSNGSIPQAYFVRYGDSIVFVPNMLRKIAQDKRMGFGIYPTNKRKKQVFVQTPEDELSDAYTRTKTSMGNLRNTIKFNAIR